MPENDSSVDKFSHKMKQDSNHVPMSHGNHAPLPSLSNQPVATTTTVTPPIGADKDGRLDTNAATTNHRGGAFGDVLPVIDDNLDVR